METECPKCGDEFKSKHGMKAHHKQVHGESLAGFTHECPICEEQFETRSSESKYCSRGCYAKAHSEKMSGENHPMWAGGKVECTCEQCGKTHHKHPSKADRPYCSRSCAANAMDMSGENNPFYEGGKRIEKVCKQCNVPFESWACDEQRRFCSVECHDEWQVGKYTGPDSPVWQGGEFPYGEGWNEKKKEAVRERDNRECQQCGRGQRQHIEKFGCKHTVHHIQKAREVSDSSQRNSMENLVTLCKGKCHAKWEAMSPLRPQ